MLYRHCSADDPEGSITRGKKGEYGRGGVCKRERETDLYYEE